MKKVTKKEIRSAIKAKFGFTRLYFCSPDYGHDDYNKVRACEIKDNEEFCKKVVEIGNRS